MKKITLSRPWDHITPTKTTRFPAGEHDVTEEIAAAAKKAGRIEETKDGGSARATGAASGPGSAEK